jgi:hypothetical protein
MSSSISTREDIEYTNSAHSYPNYAYRAGTVFNNEVFIQSFAGAFADFTINGNLNSHVSTENETPNWPAWAGQHTEMLFNVTADFTTPVIHTITTDPMLIQRCE